MSTANTPLILASASARRADLLTSAAIPFEVIVSEIDETPLADEGPQTFALRMAQEKAHAVARKVRPLGDRRPILAADTVVAIDELLLGKPADIGAARAMIARLSGRTHQVLTGFALLYESVVFATTAVTEVVFRPVPADELECYLRRAAWHDKAGGYAIQGEAAGMVERIVGSHSNVIGLPLAEVVVLLAQHGITGAYR